ncbi:MAG: hypothetical protein Q7T82_05290 [Armatimonadota bacterium]|nr:hypothetical protein [Armatimonadota bacterium]
MTDKPGRTATARTGVAKTAIGRSAIGNRRQSASVRATETARRVKIAIVRIAAGRSALTGNARTEKSATVRMGSGKLGQIESVRNETGRPRRSASGRRTETARRVKVAIVRIAAGRPALTGNARTEKSATVRMASGRLGQIESVRNETDRPRWNASVRPIGIARPNGKRTGQAGRLRLSSPAEAIRTPAPRARAGTASPAAAGTREATDLSARVTSGRRPMIPGPTSA